MKNFAAWALMLSLGMFAIGCEKPADQPPADEAAPAVDHTPEAEPTVDE